jgi:glycosyltransferase involved in cell wall biosynthesis
MYPLDRGSWGPTVRIGHLRRELTRLANLDVIEGDRGARRRWLARYAVSGRLRRLDGAYVESSTFLPAEADLALLGLARALGVPVLTYIRDAYQLFADEYPAASVRQRLGRAAFRPMLRALAAVSTRLAFPTRGLARAVLGDRAADAPLLPPGSPPPAECPRSEGANRLLFVGDGRLPAHGVDRLIAAVAHARERGAKVELDVVTREGQEPPGERPAWLHVRRAEGTGIHALLPDVLATVIPRPRSAYNDLALPIKLFDYLSYGRPLLVTDCAEQAALVRSAGAGLVVGDRVEELAAGIERLAAASSHELDSWSAAAAEAARAASWERRAATIVELLVRQ